LQSIYSKYQSNIKELPFGAARIGAVVGFLHRIAVYSCEGSHRMDILLILVHFPSTSLIDRFLELPDLT
jgi:hypothetical protein